MSVFRYFEFQKAVLATRVSIPEEFLANLSREIVSFTDSSVCYIFCYDKKGQNSYNIHKYRIENINQSLLCDGVIGNLALDIRINERLLKNEIYIPEVNQNIIAGYKLNTCLIPFFEDEESLFFLVIGRNAPVYNPDSLDHLQKAVLLLWHVYLKHLELARMQDIYDQLIQKSKLKEDRINSIIHELRGPIVGISGFIRLLPETEKLTQKGKKYLEIISESSEELIRNISRYDDLSESGIVAEEKSIDFEITSSQNHDRSGPKIILIAEDDDINFLLMRQFLRETDYRIVRAVNGKEAIKYCTAHKPDLVIMDIMMPELDGFEATIQIKKLHPELKIIAQTAFLSERARIMESGCTDILAKPFARQQLISIINSYI